MTRNPLQFELFDQDKASFPVRSAVDQLDIDKFRSRIKRAMARAIRECPHEVAAKTEIRLSASTIRAHTHHDKITADGYATLPKWLLENGELVTDSNGRSAFVGDYQGKHYHAGVKVVHKDGHDEIYLTSLRRTEGRKIKKLTRK